MHGFAHVERECIVLSRTPYTERIFDVFEAEHVMLRGCAVADLRAQFAACPRAFAMEPARVPRSRTGALHST